MECTFFKSVALDIKTEAVREESIPSGGVIGGEKRDRRYDLDNLSQ